MADGAELILRGLQPAIGLATPVSAFMQGAQDQNTLANQLLNNQLLQQRYAQSEQMNPLLMQEAQQNLALGGQRVAAGQAELDQYNQGQMVRNLQTIATESLQLPPNARRQYITGKLKTVDFGGMDGQQLIDEVSQMDDAQLEQSLRSMMSAADTSEQTAEMRTFNAMIEGMTPEEKAGARKVWAGIQARAGESAQERIARTGITGEVAQSEAEIAAAKAGAAETAELDVQLEKKPQLEAKVEQARLEVQAKVEKQIAQQGQLGRLGDAQMIYSDLMPDGPEDLSKLSRIYGRGESFYPKILRSQEGINTIAQRDQLVSMLQLGARGELKGQGPITENEQAILSKAITILSEPDISPKLAAREINQAMNILGRNAGKATATPQATGGQAKQFKSGSGITFTVE